MASVKLPTFPNVDFSKLDTDAITNAAKDVAYITVGLAVLAFQKAQVRRNEMIKAFTEQFEAGKAQLESIVGTARKQVSGLVGSAAA